MTRTIDDLRSTFAGHADELTDAGLPGRSAAVATRVRHVRRRRRAALAGGLAVVLAVVGTGLALGPLQRHDRSLEPTAPLAGHAIPRDVVVSGFTYKLATTAESKPGDRLLTLSLPKSDRDRVVSLVANGLDSGDATLFLGNGKPDAGVAGRPAGYMEGGQLDRVIANSAVDVPVEVGAEAMRLTVRTRDAASGSLVGLAVYEQSDSLPEGVSAHGMAFPKTVGDEHLIAGVIGQTGDDSVSITFQGPVRHPDLQGLCATAEKNIEVSLTNSGAKGSWSRSCSSFDPIGDVNLGVGHDDGVAGGYGPGRHTVTLKVYRFIPHHRAVPVDLSDVRLALGLYDNPSPVRNVDGMGFDTRISTGAQMWQLDRVVPYVEGRTTVHARSGPVMIDMVYTGHSNTCPVAVGSGGPAYYFTCGLNSAPGAASMGGVLMPGATYTLSSMETNNEQKPGHGLTDIVIYRPVD